MNKVVIVCNEKIKKEFFTTQLLCLGGAYIKDDIWFVIKDFAVNLDNNTVIYKAEQTTSFC
jgi:hypothetical protein